MKLLHILLIGMLLLCGSGIASAGNETGVMIGGIIDMGEVKSAGGDFWDSANQNGNAGYVLLGIGFVAWMLIIAGAAFIGSASYAVGKETKNADTTQSGTSRIQRVAAAIVAPPLLIILLCVGTGLL